MTSIAARLKEDLESRGECVIMANATTGWFAVFPATWHARTERARREGREGPNLVVYRTTSEDPRDHYAVPYSVARELLVEDTLTTSTVNGSRRWNLTLKDGKLHVSHRAGKVDVSKYHGVRLLEEVPADATRRPEYLPAEELSSEIEYVEGAARSVLVNAYERNRRAREECLRHYGRSCAVCGFNFEARYGESAAGYIQVHHIVPIAKVRKEYRLNPITDLLPVCPNCHAVIHRREPPFSIEEVQQMLRHGGVHGSSGPESDVRAKARRLQDWR